MKLIKINFNIISIYNRELWFPRCFTCNTRDANPADENNALLCVCIATSIAHFLCFTCVVHVVHKICIFPLRFLILVPIHSLMHFYLISSRATKYVYSMTFWIDNINSEIIENLKPRCFCLMYVVPIYISDSFPS